MQCIYLNILLNLIISRLSQAHARFMFHDHVTVQDTIIAIILMEYSMESSLLGITTSLHASFSEDPTKEYINQGM